VLARGAAAEILARDQDLRFGIGLPVQHEVGERCALLVIAKLGEQALAEPGALDGLEVLLGDDHVGIDIDHGQVGRDPGQRGEFFHWPSSRPCPSYVAPRVRGFQSHERRRISPLFSREPTE
jgi:hypothetical protein